MKKKTIVKAVLSLLAGCVIHSAVAADLPDIRGLGIDPISMNNEFSPTKPAVRRPKTITITPTSFYKADSEKTATLKGGLTELSATVGKSQLVKFDEPVNRISIANPSLADLVLISPQEMIINGKAGGTTSLIIWGSKKDPLFFDLVVKNDTSQLLKAIKELSPEQNLDLKFTNDTNLILSGKVSSTILRNKIKSLTEAYGYKLVDVSESPTPQVLLEVKVAEASRAFTRYLKSNFTTGDLLSSYFKPTTDSAVTTPIKSKGFSFDGTLNGLQGYTFNPSQKFSGMLTAAEQKGYVKILAEPKLVATNGNKASFNAGQQVPVPSSMGQDGNIAYEFKDVGVNVSFTPNIMEDSQRVQLNITPEVSEIDTTTTITQQNGGKVYGFKTRKADTTVELNSGQVLVIAGLLKKSDQTTKTQVPLLGDLPIIGNFFRSSDFRKEDTELIIFVTPRIISPDNTSDGV